MDKFFSEWSKFYDDVVEVFSADQPAFLSRIGGSDTEALLDMQSLAGADEKAMEDHYRAHLTFVERYNGFYCPQGERIESYHRYLDVLKGCYAQIKMTTMVHTYFLSVFFPESIHPNFFTKNVPHLEQRRKLVEQFAAFPDFIGAYPYNFIEGMVRSRHSLFFALSKILKGKKVLVICPFGESIELNFKNRRHFFKHGYVYPDFDLRIVNSPITYAGMPKEMYPDVDWFATVRSLETEIRARDFDIALLACGSYAMPLGVFIEKELRKKAIYFGGVMQLYFGVMGRRYENPYFIDQINREYFIHPVERERYAQMLPQSDHVAREAFGAYF